MLLNIYSLIMLLAHTCKRWKMLFKLNCQFNRRLKCFQYHIIITPFFYKDPNTVYSLPCTQRSHSKQEKKKKRKKEGAQRVGLKSIFDGPINRRLDPFFFFFFFFFFFGHDKQMPRHGGQLRHLSGPRGEIRMRLVHDLGSLRS
jgi:hypothetical protein